VDLTKLVTPEAFLWGINDEIDSRIPSGAQNFADLLSGERPSAAYREAVHAGMD
jgi:hypothetical protein